MDKPLLRARVAQYLRARQITAQCFLVAEALIRHVNRRGTAWPSERTLADAAGCTERSVRRHKQTLQAIGLLTWVRRRRTSCLYRLSAPPVFHAPMSKERRPAHVHGRSVQENHPYRDSAATESGLGVTPALAGALARLSAAIGVPAEAVMPWLTTVRPG